MLLRPAFDPRWRVTLVPGQGIFFSCERDCAIVEGLAFERVARLINGRRTAEAIVDALETQLDLESIYYALLELERRGYVHEASVLPRSGAVKAATLQGLIDGVRVVLVDDYLDPRLGRHNKLALRKGRPWMIAKMVGAEMWIGPVFIPGETACWSCLAHRLRVTRPVDAFLATRRKMLVLSRPAPASAGAVRQVLDLVSSTPVTRMTGTIITVDVASGTQERHVVVTRPQCPICGDPATYARQLERFKLDRPRAIVDVWRGRSRLVNPVIGITASIGRISSHDSKALHVYVAAPTMPPLSGRTWNVATLHTVLHVRSCGSGTTRVRAMRSALAEVVERYCGAAHGDEPIIRSALMKIGSRGLHPNACMLYSDAQLRARREWNARGDVATIVPERFDPRARIDWTPVWSLTSGAQRLLPTAFLYRDARHARGRSMCVADSNGNAAGRTLTDAILRGFLELIERDSVAIWWYNRLPRPAVDLGSLRNSYFHELTHAYRKLGRVYWVLDITADLGVPTFAAISCRRDSQTEIRMGFGADLDAPRAVLHAVTEMNQMVASLGPPRGTYDLPVSRTVGQRIHEATFDSQPHLGTPSCGPISLNAGSHSQGDLEYCRSLVTKAGLELLVLDQTRPDIGVPVVKVMVPGLRPAAARFAPGRLYDVPVRMGWLSHSTAEHELNPVPLPL